MRIHAFMFILILLSFAGSGFAQTPWLSPYGDASCSSNFMPTFHTGGEMPVLGKTGFQVISENLIGGTAGILWISAKSANLSLLGLTLYVDPTSGFGVVCQASGATGVAGAGMAAVPLPLPADPFLAGFSLFLQGFYLDTSTPLMLVHTHGLGLTIAQSAPIEVSVVRDRQKYQAHFAGATAALADQLGRGIWVFNQVPGFNYAKTEQFACGGQSHWMVIVVHVQTGMEFCLIPGGGSRMGDINGTGYPSELPVHRVRVAPFLLARTEVTQGQFTQVMGTSPWVGQTNVQIGSDYAASWVNRNDSSAFCAKAGFRLPTEAEWEYACRAGTETCYHFGENYPPASLGSYAWCSWNTTSQQYAHQVGKLLPNAFGIFDMHGNVWEWVEDPWHGNYQCAPADGRAWAGSSAFRVYRGGGWVDTPQDCRTAIRYSTTPAYRHDDYGFRPACSLR